MGGIYIGEPANHIVELGKFVEEHRYLVDP